MVGVRAHTHIHVLVHLQGFQLTGLYVAASAFAKFPNKVKPGTPNQSGAQSRPNGLQPETENV